MQTILLSAPYEVADGMISKLSFREPTYHDIVRLGDPTRVVYMADGSMVFSDDWTVIDAYAQRLLKQPEQGPGISLAGLPSRDALAVARLIRSFFEGGAAMSGTPPQPGSSSISAGPRLTSAG